MISHRSLSARPKATAQASSDYPRLHELSQNLLEQSRGLRERSRGLMTTTRASAETIKYQWMVAEHQLAASRRLSCAVGEPLYPHAAQRNAYIGSRECDPKGTSDVGGGSTFGVVEEMIGHIERSVATETGVLALLSDDIMLTLDSTISTDIVLAMFLQGIIQTLQDRLPVAEQREAALLLFNVLWDHISNKRAGG